MADKDFDSGSILPELYRLLYEDALDGMAFADAETGIILDCNRAFTEMVERDISELIGQPQTVVHPPDDKTGEFSQSFRLHRKEKSGEIVETRIITKSGKLKYVEVKAVPLEWDGRRILHGTFHDITEHKQTEEMLTRRSAQLASLYQVSQDIVATLELEEVCIAAHQAVTNLMPADAFFISLLDNTGQEVHDIYLYDNGKRWPNESTLITEEGMIAHVIHTSKPIWIEDDLDGESQKLGAIMYGSSKDTNSILMLPLKVKEKVIGVISAQHYQPKVYTSEHFQMLSALANQVAIAIENARLVQSLNEAHQRLESFFENTHIQIAHMDANFNFIQVNQAFAVSDNQAFAVSDNRLPEFFTGKNHFDLYPDAEIETIFREIVKSGKACFDFNQPFENKFNKKRGISYWDWSLVPIRAADGSVIEVILTLLNVTAKKKAEDALRRHAEEMDALQATVLGITAPNKSLTNLLYSIVDRAAGLLNASSGGLYLTEPEHQRVRCVVSYKTVKDFTGTTLAYGEGAAGHVAQTGRPLLIDDYRIWSGRAEVYRKEESFQSIISAPLIWRGDVIGVIHALREEENGGFNQEELFLLTLFANHATVAVENARLYTSIEQELAERKQAQIRLQASEQQYRHLYNSIADAVFVRDFQGKILDVNHKTSTRYGYSKEEFQRMNIADIIAPDQRVHIEEREQKLTENREITFESVHINRDKVPIPTEINSTLISYHGQEVILSISRDITERKQAEESLKRLLQEKEILLAEVHHRVKNNMQVIISLLGLQAGEIEDDGIRGVYEESRSRIYSMALVHEQLYNSQEYARIDFQTYIDQLSTSLLNTYSVEPERVQLRLEAKHIYLDLERAIPCGLLLNELITNSLKYAFPNGRSGQISVHFKPDDNKMLLTFGDDGVGLPDNFDLENIQSLGLQLVHLLVTHDLHGSLQVESARDQGTRFHIEFPIKPF